MRRELMTVLAVAMLLMFSGSLKAETHEHLWSIWDYYKTDTNYHYGQRYCYDCGQTQTIKEAHALMPYPSYYEYDNENICCAEYQCKICGNLIKIPTSHKWSGKISSWTWFSDEQHFRSIDKKCSQCSYLFYDIEKQYHNLGFHWTTYNGQPAVYWGCDICNYAYDNQVRRKTRTITNKLDRKHYYTQEISLLHNDSIKSVKVTSGKKKIKVKKLSKSKIKITPKKKGNAKVQIKMKAGWTVNYKYKIK